MSVSGDGLEHGGVCERSEPGGLCQRTACVDGGLEANSIALVFFFIPILNLFKTLKYPNHLKNTY